MQLNPDTQQKRLWDVAAKLVAFDSVSVNSSREIVLFVADALDAAGAKTHVITDSIGGVEKASLLALYGPSEIEGFALSGHCDVVPFNGQMGWRTDPLKLHV